ncbi:hypothetical protein CHS0354_010610 [Potamilus streckersoni]|uniref:SOSS complex subunit C homolog n=1 Tax=Potamilus streckersoni TaxID=2493646 RepID=A0AAE0VW07_9BIVA|nr:hypothetical protein CHS0354_010610 [Potamilus streckersoni]
MEQRQNRKLLEQLEEQKKRLRGIPTHHGSVLSNATTPGAAAVISSVAVPLPPQINPISSTHANANSVGFFITQDSSFGNLILPVLPRFDK